MSALGLVLRRVVLKWHKRWRWNRCNRGYRRSLEIREEVFWTTDADRGGLVNLWEWFPVPLQNGLNTFTKDA